MSYQDSTANVASVHVYEISAVITWGLRSAKTKAMPRQGRVPDIYSRDS
jgi:hypothetical protein